MRNNLSIFKIFASIIIYIYIYWKSGECYQPIENTGNFFKWICIRDTLTYGDAGEHYPKDLEEVDADFFIRTNGLCVEDVYDDLQKEDSEYLIFVEGKFKPSKIHTSLDEAEQEARRLCEKEMKEVHILKSVKRFKPKITIEEI